MHSLAISLYKSKSMMTDYRPRKHYNKLPFWEGLALSYIIITLKLFLGLNDNTERWVSLIHPKVPSSVGSLIVFELCTCCMFVTNLNLNIPGPTYFLNNLRHNTLNYGFNVWFCKICSHYLRKKYQYFTIHCFNFIFGNLSGFFYLQHSSDSV